jgi:hypothetical protein
MKFSETFIGRYESSPPNKVQAYENNRQKYFNWHTVSKIVVRQKKELTASVV